ncbi:hypothetical protein CEXT_63301 [Caerostris extrusa]|uniref:Uncharacterized protein n=1 Tax=Caerostris extrusa TaxID=172846 RepID=A0AAV4WDF2_CAEEX|nr:hypothetical protein CEXT_63301 [Caerostris extrusa]
MCACEEELPSQMVCPVPCRGSYTRRTRGKGGAPFPNCLRPVAILALFSDLWTAYTADELPSLSDTALELHSLNGAVRYMGKFCAICIAISH